jgi:hypothetical protein
MPDCFLTAAERSDPTAQSQLFSKGEPLFPSSVWEKACTTDISTWRDLARISYADLSGRSLGEGRGR